MGIVETSAVDNNATLVDNIPFLEPDISKAAVLCGIVLIPTWALTNKVIKKGSKFNFIFIGMLFLYFYIKKSIKYHSHYN
ncbi:hypothetical protein GCM10010984_16840 [Chishuiella changwenlii]|uniref:Uncharacterized protein n=1 Tax=Chishuiella changwenlii TaxID=1434701 RepID=A0ABQ1TNQ4_9FLAO|nr:hypothetical protein GCM10010984_16840 [Chishuiella changwenlii]